MTTVIRTLETLLAWTLLLIAVVGSALAWDTWIR